MVHKASNLFWAQYGLIYVVKLGFPLSGKLLVGKDEYSFAAIAKPYAQELLDRESTRQYTLQQVSRQVILLYPLISYFECFSQK